VNPDDLIASGLILLGAAGLGTSTVLWFRTRRPFLDPAGGDSTWGTAQHAGADEDWGGQLHAMVVERDLAPAVPLDPDDQAWADEIAGFKSRLDQAMADFARNYYRLVPDALTDTGTIPAVTR
jgi:hypothetical protein